MPLPQTMMTTGIRRTAELAAMFMIGDGLLGLIQPTRHVDLWRSKVDAADRLVRPFGDRPGLRRAYGLAQIAAGVILAAQLRPVASKQGLNGEIRQPARKSIASAPLERVSLDQPATNTVAAAGSGGDLG